MKKDYISASNSLSQPETEFVKDYWTKRWRQLSFQPGHIANIFSTEEYKAIKSFLPLLPRRAKILNGGCGLDPWTQYFKSLGYQPVGLDISQKTIQMLKRLYPSDKYVFGDIRKTKFNRHYFDAYISWGTFEHFEAGLGECLQEANRILKPNGLLFISVPYQNLRHIIKGFFPQPAIRGQARFYQWRLTRSEIIQAMEQNGFRIISVKTIHKAHGIRQLITHDLHLPPQSIWHRPLQLLFYPFLPHFFVSHMLLAIGRKK